MKNFKVFAEVKKICMIFLYKKMHFAALYLSVTQEREIDFYVAF